MSPPPATSRRHRRRRHPATARSDAVHGDGGGRGAAAEQQQQQPGLGLERCPGIWRLEATPDMAGGGGSVGDEEDAPLALAAPALHAAVSRLDAAVPRKARSCLPRAVPSSWWSCRIPVLLPLSARYTAGAEEEDEGSMFPHRQRVSVAPSPYSAAPAAAEKPGKRARRCLSCDAAETPRWWPGPTGQAALCNACRVWYSTAGELPEHRPPAARAFADSLLERPVWEPEVPGVIYLVRKSARQRRPPRTEASPVPRPRTTGLHCGSPETPKWREGPMGLREVCNACGGVQYKEGRLVLECRPTASQIADSPEESSIVDSPPESPTWEPDAPAVYLARKPAKRRMKAASPPGQRKKSSSCAHCGSSETPQWREGPMGRGTLCNACGVRYKQGRLLPEYRPMASPTFVPSKHANSHRRVLELHRKRQGKDQHPPPPSSPAFAPSKHGNKHCRAPKLRQKQRSKDQHLQNLPPIDGLINPVTGLINPVTAPEDQRIDAPCCPNNNPVDGLINPVTAPEDQRIDAPCFPNNNPVDAPGCANVPADAPSSLDSLLFEGPSAPLILESDEFDEFVVS